MPIVQNKKPDKRQLTAKTFWSPASTPSARACRIRQLPGFVCCNRPSATLAGYPVGPCQAGEPLASFLCFDAERDGGPGPADAQVVARQAEIDSRDEGTVERRGAEGRQLIARHRRMADGSLLFTVTDVADVRRAEAALRASEQRYALVAEAATEGFYDGTSPTTRCSSRRSSTACSLRFERPARPAMERARHAGGLPALSRRAARLLHAAHRPLPVRVPHPGGLRRSPLAEGSRQRGALA